MAFLDNLGLSRVLEKIKENFAPNITFDKTTAGLVPPSMAFDTETRFLKDDGSWEAVNNYTTGINLFRSTRDLTIGNETDKLYDDRFSLVEEGSNIEVLKNPEGFAYFSTETPSKYSVVNSSKVYGMTEGDTVTISFDVAIEDTKSFDDSKPIMLLNVVTSDPDEQELFTPFEIPIGGYLELLQGGKWGRIRHSLDIFRNNQEDAGDVEGSVEPEELGVISVLEEDEDNDYEGEAPIEVPIEIDYIYVSFIICNEDGLNPISVCKPKLERGEVSNPIWSISPFDIVDDITFNEFKTEIEKTISDKEIDALFGRGD